MTVFSNGQIVHISSLFDSNGKDITDDYIYELVTKINTYRHRVKDSDMTDRLAKELPPDYVRDTIVLDTDNHVLLMSPEAVDWWEHFVKSSPSR